MVEHPQDPPEAARRHGVGPSSSLAISELVVRERLYSGDKSGAAAQARPDLVIWGALGAPREDAALEWTKTRRGPSCRASRELRELHQPFDVLWASAESLPDVGDVDSGISETEHSALDRAQLAVFDFMA